MIETVREAIKYGLGGISLLGVAWLLYLFYKLERRMFKHEENYKDIEVTCSKRSIFPSFCKRRSYRRCTKFRS